MCVLNSGIFYIKKKKRLITLFQLKLFPKYLNLRVKFYFFIFVLRKDKCTILAKQIQKVNSRVSVTSFWMPLGLSEELDDLPITVSFDVTFLLCHIHLRKYDVSRNQGSGAQTTSRQMCNLEMKYRLSTANKRAIRVILFRII